METSYVVIFRGFFVVESANIPIAIFFILFSPQFILLLSNCSKEI